MKPQDLLRHCDTGDMWPIEAGAELSELPGAYQTALAVRALRQARGERLLGYKVGFTNRTIWSRYGVFAPIWGAVWDTTATHCGGAGSIPLAHLCQPRIEPEAVFGFRATPRANATLQDLFDALDWVAPGFEVVQSHRPDWRFNASQSVADGGLHGRLLIGKSVPVSTLAQDADQLHLKLATARVNLHRNGELVETGAGANVLDSPLKALLHFLTELRSCPGATDVGAGNIVTTGTWTDAWPVMPGQTWLARFDAALPELQARFES